MTGIYPCAGKYYIVIVWISSYQVALKSQNIFSQRIEHCLADFGKSCFVKSQTFKCFLPDGTLAQLPSKSMTAENTILLAIK